MNKSYFLVFISILLFISGNLSAQDADKSGIIIDLDSAWKMMEEHNIELQKLQIDQETILREAENKKYWIPGISTGASLSRSSPFISMLTDPGSSASPEGDNWSMRYSIDTRLSLKFNIKLQDQKEAAELSILMLQRRSRENELKASLQKLYYQIITGDKTIELYRQSTALAQSRQKPIETQYNQGLRSDLELLAAKIAAAGDLPAYERVMVEQQKRLITFREYTGIDENTSFTLSEEPSEETHYIQIINNYELQLAELQIKLAEINRDLSAKNLFSPLVSLNLGWSTSINPVFNSASWTAENWTDNAALGLSLSVPLSAHIKGTEGKLNLQRLDADIHKMNLSLKANRDSIKKEIRFLMLDLELCRSNIEVSELNLTLQEQNFKKMQENFDAGRASLLDLNDSRQDLRAAKLSLENEKLNQRLIQIDLKQINGVL